MNTTIRYTPVDLWRLRVAGPWPARRGAARAGLAARSLRTLSCWLQRWGSRRSLGELDDHLLRDIGLTRAQAHHEAAKFFWQA